MRCTKNGVSRIFYVGMTRAKDRLHLFRCQSNGSAFIREVVNALPVEQSERDSIFPSLEEDLWGRSYIHKSNGKGRVIAQSGQLLLIEYENNQLDLLTISELYEERQIIRVKEAKIGSKPEKKQGKRTSNHRANSAHDPKILLAQLTSGKTVTHIKLGEA